MNLQNTVDFTSFKKTNIAIRFNHLVQVCLSLSPLSICYVLSNHLNVSSNLVVSDNFNGRFICNQALNHRRCNICSASRVTTLEENQYITSHRRNQGCLSVHVRRWAARDSTSWDQLGRYYVIVICKHKNKQTREQVIIFCSQTLDSYAKSMIQKNNKNCHEPDQLLNGIQANRWNSKLVVNRLYNGWHQARLPVVNYPAPIKNLEQSSSEKRVTREAETSDLVSIQSCPLPF